MKPNNPPAFPQVGDALGEIDGVPVRYPAPDSGMTLRDYAAIAALQFIGRIPRDHHETILEDVELAFKYADAVLEERVK